MLPAKYQPNRLVVLEKKSFERFLPYMGMTAILNRTLTILAIFRSHNPLGALYEIWLHLAKWFQR